MAHYIAYQDGSKYCGEYEGSLSHGYGILVEPANQGVFEGLWVKGKQISGVYTWSSGKQYVGDWKGSLRNGLGVETRPDGTKYSGDFSQDVMGPIGVLSLPNHGLYLGAWIPGRIQEGEGIEAYADGGFYRGQYKNGSRSGYGTRTSLGYETIKEKTIDKKKYLTIQRPSTTSLMSESSLFRSTLSKKTGDGHRCSADNILTGVSWNQLYEGEWVNDKRAGHGILKVSDYFTYYGQWKDNSRTGFGVLVYESLTEKGEKREERKEEGIWENGRLIEPIKYKNNIIKSDLQSKVEGAHTEAIKAAHAARDKALLAETKANAAAAKSHVAEMRAMEARQHAVAASRIVENAAKIASQAMDDAFRIKENVHMMVQTVEHSAPRPSRSASIQENITSYSYLKLAEENRLSIKSKKTSIPSASSFHNLQEVKTSSGRSRSKHSLTASPSSSLS